MDTRFDLSSIRKEFPVTRKFLYFDCAHQAPLASSVRAALHRFYDEGHENAGPKPLWLGRIDGIRARAAALIGARADEIAFTKNTSEGLNIAANAIALQAGDNVLMVEGDHPNNSYAWLNLRRKGVEIRFISAAAEPVSAATFAHHADERTRAIALSHVTSDTGARCDLAGIGAFCKARGIYLVVDAIQSVGILPIDVEALGISMLAAGCHKGLLVPQGLGMLYVSRTLDALQPAYLAVSGVANPPRDRIVREENMVLRAGAGRFELGNLNLPNLHALDAALALIEGIGVDRIAGHVLALSDRLAAHMERQGIRSAAPRSPYRSHIQVLDLPGSGWPDYLASENVRVSPQRGGIRVSLAMFNTEEEVDRLADIIRRRTQA